MSSYEIALDANKPDFGFARLKNLNFHSSLEQEAQAVHVAP